jgi:glucoamylase
LQLTALEEGSMSGASTRLSSVPRRPFAALAAIVVVALLGVSIPGGAAGAKPRTGRGHPSGEAPGGPGAQAYLDEARKDCFGTARDSVSKVWFTVADGVLSDVFSPTVENTNVKTVQYLVTDGRTFTALQQRDMTYTVSSPDRGGMVCATTSLTRPVTASLFAPGSSPCPDWMGGRSGV